MNRLIHSPRHIVLHTKNHYKLQCQSSRSANNNVLVTEHNRRNEQVHFLVYELQTTQSAQTYMRYSTTVTCYEAKYTNVKEWNVCTYLYNLPAHK